MSKYSTNIQVNSTGNNLLERRLLDFRQDFSSTSPVSQFGRVIKVILNNDIEDPKVGADPLAFLGIRYEVLGSEVNEIDPSATVDQLPFAYPLDSNFIRVPLEGEIVEIVKRPVKFNEKEVGLDNFYSFPLNVWNKTQENIFPNFNLSNYQDKVDTTLQNTHSYPSLEPFKGDIILEGRGGQSIRMTNFGNSRSPYVDTAAFSYPLIIMSNGRPRVSNDDLVFEDVNNDDSSIYLTSNHKIPLNQANKRRKSYDSPPEESNSYRGKQIIANSDRIFLNSRKSDILLSSAKSIGLNAKSVNLDSDSYIALDSSKIYLGEEARSLPSGQKQNGVRGRDLEVLLTTLFDLLSNISKITKTVIPAGIPISLALTTISATISTTLPTLNILLKNIKSKKVFIE